MGIGLEKSAKKAIRDRRVQKISIFWNKYDVVAIGLVTVFVGYFAIPLMWGWYVNTEISNSKYTELAEDVGQTEGCAGLEGLISEVLSDGVITKRESAEVKVSLRNCKRDSVKTESVSVLKNYRSAK